ncbi:hypothetical protein Pla52o_22870 [Novipirellula galeiformis]|uniref:Glycerophosphoryl diester phosphodiesterase membrane domain-containing protein n=1 Tax=Novipirellula galeiformis TaxID=2528004 RepID=A0A5C6CID0_9BACT|nr:hypothetical protein [Novipirellula galeiformis]TWU24360.1 hypothetical protein Pla52o_22870 [Novipirellula galeiformis]
MQLDRTHVVIRRRTLSEIGDLSLVMLRRYPAAIAIGFFVGACPWAILNALLLYWIPLSESDYGADDPDAVAEIWRYVVWMSLLVILQTPAAGVATTIYLGQAVFESRPTWASVFHDAKQYFWRWFWVLGVVRWAVPAMVICAFRLAQPATWFWDAMVPICLLVVAALVRSNRPFMPEILLLEQCPLRSPSASVITLRRRSRSLHQPMASDLSGRFLASAFILFWIFMSVLCSLLFIRVIATGTPDWDLFFLLGIFPASLWLVASVSVVMRLLNYLDTRIRLEGWEVELAIRAEAMRQFGEDAGLSVRPSNKPEPTKPRSSHATTSPEPQPPASEPDPTVHSGGGTR